MEGYNSHRKTILLYFSWSFTVPIYAQRFFYSSLPLVNNLMTELLFPGRQGKANLVSWAEAMLLFIQILLLLFSPDFRFYSSIQQSVLHLQLDITRWSTFFKTQYSEQDRDWVKAGTGRHANSHWLKPFNPVLQSPIFK